MTERKALGKGISSLIRKPTASSSASNTTVIDKMSSESDLEDRLVQVALTDVRVNPRNPRRSFSEESLQELASSIRASGILQPLLVRRVDKGYELIAGERRFRSAKLAGLTHVPALVRRTTDRDQLELALVENLQRQDLSPIEEARGYQRLAQEFALTQEQIANRVSKDRTTITNLLRLLKLPVQVQELVNQGVLSMGHARALLSVDNVRWQEVTASAIQVKQLSVRQVEALAKAYGQPSTSAHKNNRREALSPNLKHLCEEIQRKLGTKVNIAPKKKGGQIHITYHNREELDRLLATLLT